MFSFNIISKICFMISELSYNISFSFQFFKIKSLKYFHYVHSFTYYLIFICVKCLLLAMKMMYRGRGRKQKC